MIFNSLFSSQVPEDDRDRVCHLFRARIVNPMKALVKREGDKAASGCYNKLWAMRVSPKFSSILVN